MIELRLSGGSGTGRRFCSIFLISFSNGRSWQDFNPCSETGWHVSFEEGFFSNLYLNQQHQSTEVPRDSFNILVIWEMCYISACVMCSFVDFYHLFYESDCCFRFLHACIFSFFGGNCYKWLCNVYACVFLLYPSTLHSCLFFSILYCLLVNSVPLSSVLQWYRRRCTEC